MYRFSNADDEMFLHLGAGKAKPAGGGRPGMLPLPIRGTTLSAVTLTLVKWSLVAATTSTTTSPSTALSCVGCVVEKLGRGGSPNAAGSRTTRGTAVLMTRTCQTGWNYFLLLQHNNKENSYNQSTNKNTRFFVICGLKYTN